MAPSRTLPNANSSSSSPKARLQNITAHMSQPITTSFPAEIVPQAPEDPLFGLTRAFKADTFDKKVDLGVGAYRDNNAKPYILPVVKKVIMQLSVHLSCVADCSHRRTNFCEVTPH